MNTLENFMELEKLVSAITHGNQSDPRLIFSNVLQLLQTYFKSDWCILRKLNDFNQNLEIVEYNGLSNDEFDKLKSLTTSSWVYSKIVVKKELIQVNNLSTKSSINNEVYISLGILSFIATPIIVNNKAIGSIKVYNKKPRFWKKSELAFLKIVASQLSLTMSNFDMMNRYRADHRATLNAIIKLLEIKDKYTAGHSHKVAYYSMLIAEELQLSREEIKMIEIAAILHDIGKIVISSRILSKLGKLNEEEFLEMKKHPLIGATVLRSGGFNESICETVEQHHEWWNGKGYPYGISGSNISLYARIVAVADAYDTMTSHRPYHKNKSHSEAIVEIVQCTGTQFCPTAAEAFLSIQL